MPNLPLTPLLTILPQIYHDWLTASYSDSLTEIFFHVGDYPKLRFGAIGWEFFDELCTIDEINEMVEKIGTGFDRKNRAGINGELHRFACIKNSQKEIIGLTVRVAREIEGLEALLQKELDENLSILLIAPPSRGKTTFLRNIAQYLSETKNRNTLVVDYSNEIAGGGNEPHNCIGFATRLQVSADKQQYQVMLEAVENHAPEVVIVDEISTREDAHACKSITDRGVALIATAHGKSLADLIKNYQLNTVLGGLNTVTLGDGTVLRKDLDRKSYVERVEPSSFDVIVEINAHDEISLYSKVDEAVDALLANEEYTPETRRLHQGKVLIIGNENSKNSIAEKLKNAKNKRY